MSESADYVRVGELLGEELQVLQLEILCGRGHLENQVTNSELRPDRSTDSLTKPDSIRHS